MTDDIVLNSGDSAGATVATDEIAGKNYQIVKVTFGALDSQVLASAGTGTDDAGTQRVSLATDIALPTPGTAAASLGKAEDAAHSSGDVGVMSLAVRQDSFGSAAADGDYHSLLVNEDGELKTVAEPEISSGNSSTSILDPDETFTGTWENISKYAAISINIFSDEDSAADGVQIQFSQEGTNTDQSQDHTLTGNEAFFLQAMGEAHFFRIVYTNGSTIQTAFRLECIYKITPSVGEVQPLDLVIEGDADAQLVRAILAGESPAGPFVNVQATNAGNLKTSIEEVDVSASGLGKAEDAAHTSGDVGVFSLSVRSDAAAASAGTDGDYQALITDANGRLHVIAINPGVFAVQEDGDALTALQLIDDPVFADDAAFTLASSKVMMAGAIRDDNPATLSAAAGDAVPLRVNQQGHLHVHSHIFEPGTLDSFGHLLTAEAANQIDIQFFRDTPANLLTISTAGGGATSQVGGAGKFETSTAGTANAKGISTQNTSYRSGAEIFAIFTATFTTPTDGNGFQRIGLYDDDNGMFIGFEGTSFGVTIRNGASDTTIAKGAFSDDDLTGAAASRFTRSGVPEAIDLTKFNVFRIRYGWLGSAPIEFEVLSPDGRWVTMHRVMQPNIATVASTENPDLPMTVHVSKSGADGTNLIVTTNCWGAGVTERALPLSETLTDDVLAQISRVVIVGKTAGGSYVNVQTTNSGNLKTALDEYDGVPTGAGTAAGALRVELPTDGTGKVGLNAGAALVGDVGLSGARTSGGTTPYKNIDVDAKDEIKATAGQVYWIHAMNTTDAPVFLKFYDSAAGDVTVGTTVPDFTFLVPANADTDGAGFTLSVPNGIEFGTGITIAGTLLVADNDNTALGGNALIVNLGYA